MMSMRMQMPNSRRYNSIQIALCALLCANALHAKAAQGDTPDLMNNSSISIPTQPMFALNGFGTIEEAHTSENYGDYVFDNLQPKGIGRNRSRIGLQLTSHLTSTLSGVLQVISEYRWNNTYTPFVSWANLQYAVTPDFSVRIGRIAMPSFMASDSRKIGFSNITARPPVEVYSLLALKTSDGVDTTYRMHFNDTTDSTTLLYGKSTVTNTSGVNIHSTDIRGIFNSLEFGATTLHAAYQERNVDNQHPALGKFFSAGINYDPGTWFASAEWVKVINFNGKGLKVPRVAWDINAGRRFGDFAPYVTIAALQPNVNTGSTPIAQRSYAVGVRWDLMRNIDVKAQLDHVQPRSDSYGTLLNVKKGSPTGSQFNVVSVVVDFIF